MKLVSYKEDFIIVEKVRHNGMLIMRFRDLKMSYGGYSKNEALQLFKQEIENRYYA